MATSRQIQAYNYFTGTLHWSQNFSAAMVAALSGESGNNLDTATLQGRDASVGGGNGIASWSSDRFEALGSPSSFQDQIAAVGSEVNSGQYPAIAALTQSSADASALTNSITGGEFASAGGTPESGSYLTPRIADGFSRWKTAGLSSLLGSGLPGPLSQVGNKASITAMTPAQEAAAKGSTGAQPGGSSGAQSGGQTPSGPFVGPAGTQAVNEAGKAVSSSNKEAAKTVSKGVNKASTQLGTDVKTSESSLQKSDEGIISSVETAAANLFERMGIVLLGLVLLIGAFVFYMTDSHPAAVLA